MVMVVVVMMMMMGVEIEWGNWRVEELGMR